MQQPPKSVAAITTYVWQHSPPMYSFLYFPRKLLTGAESPMLTLTLNMLFHLQVRATADMHMQSTSPSKSQMKRLLSDHCLSMAAFE